MKVSRLIKRRTVANEACDAGRVLVNGKPAKASVKVNNEMLRFYWSLGKDISLMHLDAKYGSGFYQIVSSDLKKILPDVHSFSVTNLKNMLTKNLSPTLKSNKSD